MASAGSTPARSHEHHFTFDKADEAVGITNESQAPWPALKRVIRIETFSRSAKALLPPHKCGGSHHQFGSCVADTPRNPTLAGTDWATLIEALEENSTCIATNSYGYVTSGQSARFNFEAALSLFYSVAHLWED